MCMPYTVSIFLVSHTCFDKQNKIPETRNLKISCNYFQHKILPYAAKSKKKCLNGKMHVAVFGIASFQFAKTQEYKKLIWKFKYKAYRV